MRLSQRNRLINEALFTASVKSQHDYRNMVPNVRKAMKKRIKMFIYSQFIVTSESSCMHFHWTAR